MKRIKLIIMLFLATATVTSFAQSSSSKFTLGIFGGLNIPRLSGGGNNELSRDYTSRSGEAFGFTSNLDLGANFSLRTDLLYSSEGGKRNGFQAIDATSMNPLAPAGTYFYADFKSQSILNYLELPVMLKYSIPIKYSNFYIDFGPYLGYLISASQKTSGSSIVYADRAKTTPITINPQTGEPYAVSFNATNDVTSSINTLNVGITGGIGYAQHIGKDQLVLDIRGAYGLNYVQKSSADGTSHTGNLLISLGYAVPL
ncbi:MAG: PorT family protein [Bacteroidales bacterium]|nr:PorT family protein [Bacteroidales bacterium]